MTLWGGRFAQKLDQVAWDLNTSLPVDKRMAIQDVDGSLAWADAIQLECTTRSSPSSRATPICA